MVNLTNTGASALLVLCKAEGKEKKRKVVRSVINLPLLSFSFKTLFSVTTC